MAEKRPVKYPRRGEVYLVAFDPARGAEIKKTRPALILQNDISNRYSSVTIVAAITSKFRQPLYPVQILLQAPEGGIETDSVVTLNQLRTVDKSRLLRCLGSLKPATMARVDRALKITLSLTEI